MSEQEQPTGRLAPIAPNPEHVAILREGVEKWNTWREDHPEVRPDLKGAYLKGTHLKRADLMGAHLEGADLNDAHLEEANLAFAHLEGADLSFAHLEEARLHSARLEGALLIGAHLEGADLRGAHLEGARLHSARLKGADLKGTHLEGADLRLCQGLRLDSSYTRNAHFSAQSRDEWSKLRRSYTGPRMVFVLIFLAAFFVPYFLKTAGWVAASHAQGELREGVAGLSAVAAALETENHPAARPIEAMVAAVGESLPSARNPRWEERTVGTLLIGFDREASYWLTALALIVYNVLRWILTGLVAPMRDEEERSGISPAYRRERRGARRWLGSWAEAYGWTIWPHRVVRMLSIVAVGSFLFHAADWLSLLVWIRVS